MPRKGRGGSRQGTPGRAYGNRTDLNARKPLAIAAPPSSQYGERTRLEDAQRAVPMAPPPAPTPPPGVSAAGASTAPPAAVPQPGPFDAPSDRPNEPATTGVPAGAGPGPEVLNGGVGMGGDPTLAELRAIYLRFPNEDVRGLIEEMESR